MKRPFSLFALLLFIAAVPAQEPLHFTPVFRNYTTDQGLPDNWIFGIQQDRQGYLWVSTKKGVCRFDGYTFRRFPDTLNANHTEVLAPNMMEDEAGRMWFADFQNRVFYIENDRIVPWKHNALLLDTLRDRINDITWLIVKGRGEEVLLGALQRGILQVSDQGTWQFLPRPAEAGWHVYAYKNRQIVCPVESSVIEPRHPFKGYLPPLFFQNEQGVILTDPLPCPDGKDVRLPYTGKLPNGGWLHFSFGYLYYFQSGRLEWYREWGEKQVTRVIQDSEGYIYVGIQRGGGLLVYRSLDDLERGRPAQRLLPGLSVSNIFIDREGGCWIGTQERGLFYCASFEQGRPEVPEALRDGIVKSIDWDRRNSLFAGTIEGRVFALDLRGAGVRDVSPPGMTYLDNLHYDTLSRTLAAAGAGQVGGFFNRGAWRMRWFYDPVLKKRMNAVAGTCFFPSRQSGVWLGTGYATLLALDTRNDRVLRNTRWVHKTYAKSVRYSAIRQDQSGRIWASNRHGLVEWVGDSILPAHQGFRALQQRISDIELLPDTSLALSPQGHGVVIWKPGGLPLEINTGQGLLSASINNLHCAPGSVIWACSERGVNKLTPNGRGGYRVTGYTMKHGLPSNTVYDAFNIGDTLWLATDKGLFRMLEHEDTSKMPAPLSASVSVNNAWYFPGKALSLPHDSADVALEFVALHFRSQGQIQYAFRLRHAAGEAPWTYTTDRRVNFPNLNPGRYRFEVKAQNEGGSWSSITALDLTIRPPWYASWWARSLAVALAALLIYSSNRHRTNRIRTESRLKEEMLRLERAALLAQMNPHFIFNCLTSIQHFILNNESDAAVSYLARFAKLVRGTLNASVSGRISLEEELRMLDHYLALEKLRFREVFEYSIRVDESVDPSSVFLPPLIVQPFVENAVLHGMKEKEKDGRITVTFRQEGGFLLVDVEDNGAGFKNGAGTMPGISLGRSITERRLDLLQKQNDQQTMAVRYFTPVEGTGTLVTLQLPV